MKFPRFKKSSAKAIVREFSEVEGEFSRFDFTYGLSPGKTTYEFNFVFKEELESYREIYHTGQGITFEELVKRYKEFIKWAKRTQAYWHKVELKGTVYDLSKATGPEPAKAIIAV